MIKLRETLEKVRLVFETAGIKYALIGGFALGAHGIHRATKDIDLLVEGARREEIKKLLQQEGFSVLFESPEVIQLQGPGYLDLLLANRPLSIEMIQTASAHHLFGVPVVSAEGIIGLKIQAYKNDAKRTLQDKADIQALLQSNKIDLNLVKKYADLFGEWEEVKRLLP